MKSEELQDELVMWYPTKVGCSQDERDKDYSTLVEEITKFPRVAVVNIINNSDGTFHTIGFVPLKRDDNFSEEDIITGIEDYACLYSEDDSCYDPAEIFDHEDYSIEFYNTEAESELQKVLDYLDCIFASENFEVTISGTEDETEEGFCDTIKEMNSSLYLALADDPDSELVIIAAEDITEFENKTIDHLPILFSDVFKNVKFAEIGSLKTDKDVVENTPYASEDFILEDVLRNKFGDDWYDEKSGENSNADEGPSYGEEESSDNDEYPPEPDEVPEEERPVEHLVITTDAYKAGKNIQTENKKEVIINVPKITHTQNQKDMKMNLFGKLNFKPVTAAVTFDGLLAIDVNTNEAEATQYKAVNANDELVDVLDETIAMELPLLMPVMGQAPEVGDYVQQGGVWYKILDDKTALNMVNGTTAGLKMTFTQFFKSSVFYRAMINPSNMMSNGLMMAMLMNGDGANGNFDMKSLMMLSMMNGQNGDFMKNPMFLMFLLGDQKEGGFDMKTLAMMSMFNGGANPFANMFGNVASAEKAAPAAAAPARPNRRK